MISTCCTVRTWVVLSHMGCNRFAALDCTRTGRVLPIPPRVMTPSASWVKKFSKSQGPGGVGLGPEVKIPMDLVGPLMLHPMDTPGVFRTYPQNIVLDLSTHPPCVPRSRNRSHPRRDGPRILPVVMLCRFLASKIVFFTGTCMRRASAPW